MNKMYSKLIQNSEFRRTLQYLYLVIVASVCYVLGFPRHVKGLIVQRTRIIETVPLMQVLLQGLTIETLCKYNNYIT